MLVADVVAQIVPALDTSGIVQVAQIVVARTAVAELSANTAVGQDRSWGTAGVSFPACSFDMVLAQHLEYGRTEVASVQHLPQVGDRLRLAVGLVAYSRWRCMPLLQQAYGT